MRSRRVTMYYCEHGGCKKRLMRRDAMERHEKGCCRNPERVCGTCKAGQLVQAPMVELIAAANVSLDALRTAADGCPLCMLAAILQDYAQQIEELPRDEVLMLYGYSNGDTPQFDFKTEHRRFWNDVNAAEREDEWNRSAFP